MPRSATPPRKIASRPSPALVKPAPVHVPAVQVPVVQQPTLGTVMKEGFAFGVGSSVARNVVDRLFSPTQQQPQQQQQPEKKVYTPDFIQCMQESKGDYEACKQFT